MDSIVLPIVVVFVNRCKCNLSAQCTIITSNELTNLEWIAHKLTVKPLWFVTDGACWCTS